MTTIVTDAMAGTANKRSPVCWEAWCTREELERVIGRKLTEEEARRAAHDPDYRVEFWHHKTTGCGIMAEALCRGTMTTTATDATGTSPDWRAILAKYLGIVGDAEGVFFLSPLDWPIDEWQLLMQLLDEVEPGHRLRERK